jgi:hypothetical protein
MNSYGLLVRKPEVKRSLGRPICRSVDNIKIDLGEIKMKWADWTWLNYLRTGTSGGLLWTRQWTFKLPKMPESPRVAAQLVAFRVVFSSIELVVTFVAVILCFSSTGIFRGCAKEGMTRRTMGGGGGQSDSCCHNDGGLLKPVCFRNSTNKWLLPPPHSRFSSVGRAAVDLQYQLLELRMALPSRLLGKTAAAYRSSELGRLHL